VTSALDHVDHPDHTAAECADKSARLTAPGSLFHPIEPKAFSPRVLGYEAIPDGMMRFRDVWLR
jgi:hypothetical protein